MAKYTEEEKKNYEAKYKYACVLYSEGVDAEGKQRRDKLSQAKNVLNLLPDDWPGKNDMISKINYML